MPDEYFLGVERSLTGRCWSVRKAEDRIALAISQRLGVPEIVGRILAARGVGMDQAAGYLNPTLKDLLPDPDHLKGMSDAVDRLAGAVTRNELVAVFGDYDVDGATSSALLRRLFNAVGARSKVYIPDRQKEGYGPNEAALLELQREGASVVVTVDCGTTSFEPLQAAHDAGLDVIVVDHHEAEAGLPAALAVINPKRLDEESPHGHLAAVGVTFLLAVALNRKLRQLGWYANRAEPNLMGWLDIVALGTICDVVPLHGVNRALVTQGLKIMAKRSNAGLAALADVAGINEPPGAYHAGFLLGPRINAGGRVGQSDLGTRLLSSDDRAEVGEIAAHLDELNRERQEIEKAVLEQALAQAESEQPGSRPVVIVVGENWHPGVVGIVASRLKDKFHRPSLVITLNGETGSGSGRSVNGVDLGAAIIAARQSGLLLKGGGHAMAAGLTVERGKVESLKTFLNDRLTGEMTALPAVRALYVDGGLKIAGANLGLAEVLESIGPYGAGNSEPRFAIASARIAHADAIGADQSHLRLTLTDESGKRLKAIAFRAVETEMGQALIHHGGAPFHIAGKLRINTWQGRSTPQLLVDDAAPVW